MRSGTQAMARCAGYLPHEVREHSATLVGGSGRRISLFCMMVTIIITMQVWYILSPPTNTRRNRFWRDTATRNNPRRNERLRIVQKRSRAENYMMPTLHRVAPYMHAPVKDMNPNLYKYGLKMILKRSPKSDVKKLFLHIYLYLYYGLYSYY